MKSKLPADDLFEKSSMSFGEHLEELRKSLAKAFIWLGVGTVLGMLIADRVVRFIETPLRQAILDYHVTRAQEEYRQVNGEEPTRELAEWIATQGLLPERVLVDPAGLQAALQMANAEALRPSGGDGKPGDQEHVTPQGERPTMGVAIEASSGGQAGENAAEPEADVASSDTVTSFSSGETGVPNAASVSEVGPGSSPWRGVKLEDLEGLQTLHLWKPISNKLISLSPIETFMIWLKAGLVAGVVIGSPGIFWHIWEFLAAGLYPHERRYVYWYLPLSLVLFLSGVSLAFFVVFRMVLGFLMTYSAGLDVEFTPRLSEYMSFALFLPLGFGIAFQLPIVMLGLHRFGLVSVASFSSQWRIAVLVIAFLSMMLSPPDIYSMMGLFIPLVGLYFFGIFLCRYMPQGAGIGGPALDPQG